MKTFKDQDEFYAERGGELSRESDYGVQWLSGGARWPSFRISYVKDTGDVYAYRQGGTGDKILLLGTVPPIETADRDFDTAWDKPLDTVLFHWWEMCGTPFSLQWVMRRLAAFPPKTRCTLQPELQATLASDDTGLD